MKEITTGLTHTSAVTVIHALTAEAMGSGDMPVFATPAMVTLMENAAMLAVAPSLGDELTTVGGRIDVSHLKASPVGASISATATLTAIEGKKLTFEIVAQEGDTIIGKGTHLRFIVDRKKFLENAGAK
ncbi:MAG: thioesterase family protein [Rikenellaceae bacterium]|nr:thioesterase family protein [Rikenellaceae bacterium]MDE7355578.1 thioesterase family protein [Rikenellaceae bacterium]